MNGFEYFLKGFMEALCLWGIILLGIMFFQSAEAFDGNGLPQNTHEIRQVTNVVNVKEANDVENFNKETNSFDLTDVRK